jgi:thiaminase
MTRDKRRQQQRHRNNNNNNNYNQCNFIGNIQRRHLANTIDAIVNHSYLEALDKKKIPKQKLEIFVCEQYHIIANDKRNFAFMISKTSNDIASKLFTTCLHTEFDALENLTLMAEELGIDKTKMLNYQPLPGCQSYTNYLTKLAVYGVDAEILAALLVDFPIWAANCTKMSLILKKNYGFKVRSCLFLDEFASILQLEEQQEAKEFVNESSKLVDSALPRYEKNMYTAARLILDYELSFWDTIYNHSINALAVNST